MSGSAPTPIDPTGAGDCFGGAYVACRRLGMPVAQSLAYANAAGARNVTFLGPMEGAGTRAELDAFIEREIVADPLDPGQHRRPVADQRCTLDRRAELAERFAHDLRVFGVEQSAHVGRAARQGGEQQHAVGNAFGAGKRDRASGVGQGWQIEECGGKHYWLCLVAMVQLARVLLACSIRPSSASPLPLEIISSMACRVR